MSNSERWWHRPFRVFQTNLREIDATLDVEQVLNHITRVGANTWLLNTAGIVSFYPSQLPFQHPSPWLAERASGDLIKDAIARAHELDVRVISRLDVSKLHRDIAEEHPDWCFVDTDGNYQIYNGLYSACPSGPYYQERVLEVLNEVLANYEPDGFFFNMFSFNQRDYSGVRHGICQCVNCRTRFRDRTGNPLPTEENLDDPVYLEWLRYTRETLEQCSVNIRKLIKQHSSDIALFQRGGSDVNFREANNAVDRPEPLWVHWAGELVQEALGSEPEKPVVVDSVMFLDIPYRFTAEQPGLLGLHLVQTMAHGGNPMAYIVGTPERFRPQAYDLVEDIIGFHKDNETVYTRSTSAARVAVIASQQSEEYYGGSQGAETVLKERRGIHRALIHGHVPFDILGDQRLLTLDTTTLAARYDVLVLPNVAALSDEQLAKIDEYVRTGGGVVATYDTASFTESGEPRGSIGLASLGAERVLTRHTGRAVRSTYLRFPEDDPGIGPNELVAIDRAFNVVAPRPGAERFGTFIPASAYGPPEKCHWSIETDHPGLVWNRFGNGRTAYIPWPVGALYHDLSLVEYRGLVLRAIEEVSPQGLQLSTDAPPQVEFTIAHQAESNTTVVHAINYSGHNGRLFTTPLEIRDISISLRGESERKTARSLQLGRDLPVSQSPEGTTVTLPSLGLFDVITFH